jgi:putative ABC transport system substrate-binding protein
MAELGWKAGQDFVFEYVYAGTAEAFLAGYRELVARGVDIMLATGPEVALRAALQTAGERPIVMVAIDYDPVARGYVQSLASGNRNITGVFFQQIELTAKRLELLREAFPAVRTVAVLWDRISADQWRAAEGAARRLGLVLAGLELRDPPYDYERALRAAPRDAGALLVTTSPFIFRDRASLGPIALRHQLPSVFVFREWVDAGGLMSYGPSLSGMYRRAAELTDRIAKGTRPMDLPIEQPTTFELVVNMKTGRALGVSLPSAILVRADEIIG